MTLRFAKDLGRLDSGRLDSGRPAAARIGLGRPGGALLAAIPLALTLAAGASAQDRDEFYAIARGEVGRPVAPAREGGFFSLFSRPAPRRVAPETRRDIPEITVRPIDTGRPGDSRARPGQAPATRSTPAPRPTAATYASGPRAFCVRACDGYFFPVGPAMSGASARAQQMTCDSLCPGAGMSVFVTGSHGDIEDARGPAGHRYATLPAAFRFRQGADRTCSCQGSVAGGLARLPITHDFTLRPGDLVVAESGVRIFRGGARFPYRNRDFVEAAAYGRLPADIRRRVAQIEAGIQAGETSASAPVARGGRLATTRTSAAASLPLSAGTVTDGVRVLNLARPGRSAVQ